MATDRPNSDYINPTNNEYYAWVCLDETELDESVYEALPFSSGKTWREYSPLTILPNGETFITFGYTSNVARREKRMQEPEFQLYRDYFQGRNIWTLAEAREYKKQFEIEGQE